MLTDTIIDGRGLLTAGEQARRSEGVLRVWFGLCLVITVAFAALLVSNAVNPGAIGWIVYLTGVAAICYRPRYGVYLMLFFTLLADKSLLLWYPFVLNFSSKESLLYLDKAFIVSPLEVYLVITALSWLGHTVMGQRRLNFYAGDLLWPVLIWIAFMALGLISGIARHGNVNIGLWECRAMFYMPPMLILTSNLITTRAQANRLLWLAMLALFTLGAIGFYNFMFVMGGEASRIISIIEHSAAVRLNTLFLAAFAVWMYRASPLKRIVFPLFVPMTFVTYMAAQRRASFVGLGLGLVLMCAVLFTVNRKWFWRIAPAAAIAGVLYLGAFWNNGGTLGMPARAVKSMIVSDAGNAQENSSNEYREIENINDLYTVHRAALLGVGFGNVFYIIAPMPDISFFEWWQYIVHNSIMWIWMKTGIGGFASMLMMIGIALVKGVQVVRRMPGGDMGALAIVALLYVFMHFTYAYVDMSWDNQSMVYVGVMMGVLNRLEAIVAQPLPPAPPKFTWQVWSPGRRMATVMEGVR
jgi:hypothetical protein